MAIENLKGAAAIPSDALEDWGTVDIPLSQPPCALRGLAKAIVGRDDVQTGVWECSPGRFRRKNPHGEFMYFLSGECTFTSDDGEVLNIQGGDTLFFSPHTEGVWDIHTTVRKVYVLV